MSRVRTPLELRRFVTEHGDVEAVLQRCGRDTFELVLVDAGGRWTPWVFTSEELAVAAAEDLEVPLHRGWDDRMSKRMGRDDPWNRPGGVRRAL